MIAVIRSVKKNHFFCKLRFNQLVQCTSSLRIQQWLHSKMLTLSHCFHTFEPMPYKQSPRDGYLHLEQKGHQFQDTYRDNFLQKAIFYTLELPQLFLKTAIQWLAKKSEVCPLFLHTNSFIFNPFSFFTLSVVFIGNPQLSGIYLA